MSTRLDASRRTPQPTIDSFNLPETRILRWFRHLNWPLLIGGMITLAIVVMAVYGPDWAAQDPMQENYALVIDGKVVRPPYPPFTLAEHPLGTDQFGRDLLSRILWGVRPTLILVTTVATVRLIVGIWLGLIIGWSGGRRGRIFDSILSAALSVPVLIVALMGISAVGIEKGLWAFIFGLALTGWAETARIISTQTRTIKGQTYVEAAYALGASELRILRKHVLHHISPLVWMLLAFEVSTTLLVVSELGFLGYYIGGGVWIEVLDFVAVNTTGLPELGQMLSDTLVSLTRPLVFIIVGSFVSLIVLGFNLLGEGLRQRLSRQIATGGRLKGLGGMIEHWLEGIIPASATDWLETNAVRLGIAGMVVLVVGGWTIWHESRPQSKSIEEQQYLVVPGGHLWATERHDAQGTQWVNASGPSSAAALWTYQAEGGFVGGPAVAADGSLYIATTNSELLALTPNGQEVWRARLPGVPVGSPALGPDGKIFIAGQPGGLTAYSPSGDRLWEFVTEGGRESTSGPVVDSQGTIYYTRVDSIQAVSPDGKPLWLSLIYDSYVEQPPVLSAGEAYIFLLSGALSASSGVPLKLSDLSIEELIFTNPAFFVGADGKTYLRTGHEVLSWVATDEGVVTGSPITWNHAGSVPIPPLNQGTTPDGSVWLLYSGEFFDTRLVWLDSTSRMLSNTRSPDHQGNLLGIDKDAIAYICSDNFSVNANCKAFEIGSETPLWELDLGDSVKVAGGALIPNRLYIATDLGTLYAVGGN